MNGNERLSNVYSNEQFWALMESFAPTAAPVAGLKPHLEELMMWAHHGNPAPKVLNLLIRRAGPNPEVRARRRVQSGGGRLREFV